MRVPKGVGVALVVVVLTLASVEGVLRMADYPRRPETGWKWASSPYKTKPNLGDGRVNQFGLRGRPIAYGDKDTVVLLVGDSQLEAGGQAADDLPEVLLEQLLHSEYGLPNARVFTVASGGWGQDQELVALRQYLSRYRADYVLIWFSPVNDYWENAYVDRSVIRPAGMLKPTFVPEGAGVRQAFPREYPLKIWELLAAGLSNLRQGATVSSAQAIADAWEAQLPSPEIPDVKKAECPTDEVPWLQMRDVYLEGRRGLTALTDDRIEDGRSRFTPFLARRSPRDEYMIDLTHRLLRLMVQEAEKSGAQVRIFYAHRSDLDPVFAEVRCVKSTVTGKYYVYDGSDFLRHVKRTELARKLVTLDLTGRDLAIAKDDWHLSTANNLRAMRQLAEKAMGLAPVQPSDGVGHVPAGSR